MRRLQQFSTVATLFAVLALPLGILGCAQDAPPADAPGAADSGADGDMDAEMEPELGEPEGGTNL